MTQDTQEEVGVLEKWEHEVKMESGSDIFAKVLSTEPRNGYIFVT